MYVVGEGHGVLLSRGADPVHCLFLPGDRQAGRALSLPLADLPSFIGPV